MSISYLNILSLKLTTHIGIMIHKKLTNESSLIPIFLNIVKNVNPNETPNTDENRYLFALSFIFTIHISFKTVI